jgi:parallel beta-helix repeat protein
VYTVSPSGGDDTANIQAAFDAAVAAGPGSVVQLTAGTFYCDIILIENFQGSFKGAGKDLTILDTVRGLDPDAPGLTLIYPDPSDPNPLNPVVFWFGFENGDVTITDMTFAPTHLHPAEPYFMHYMLSTDIRNTIWLAGTVNGRFERLGFEAIHKDDGWPEPNLGYGITPSGYWILDEPGGEVIEHEHLIGDIYVASCTFKNTFAGVGVAVADGSVVIGGSPNKKNVMDNIYYGVAAWQCTNSNVEISYNHISEAKYCGIIIDNEFVSWITSPSNVLISHNHVSGVLWADGIGIIDYYPLFGLDATLNAVVSNNNVVINSIWGGVYGIGANDAVICNNKISGEMVYGITFWESAGCTILGNNLDYVEASLATIWFDEGTSDCLVVGGGAEITVLDLGFDNTVVGVNNQHGNPPGPEIREAMEQKQAIIKSTR